MQMPSFVFFDIGLTLLSPRGASAYQEVLNGLGFQVELEAIERAFHLEDKRFMREFPGVFGNPHYSPMPWFLGGVNYRLGVRTDLCAAAALWRERQQRNGPYWVPFPEARAVLAELRRRGFGLGVISNWDPSARQLLAGHDLTDFFDPIVISSEVGSEKPAPEIFRVALQRAGLRGEQCLYVGDNYYDDAVGCRRAGMQALIINRYGRLGTEEIRDCDFISGLSDLLALLPGPPAKAP
jgi:HAD superfamily hydrolase (TIGR01549 family)